MTFFKSSRNHLGMFWGTLVKPFVVLAGFSLDFVGVFDDPFPDVQKWLEIVGNGQTSGSGGAKG